MKLWTTVTAAALMAGSALATESTPSSTFLSNGKWKINVGLGIPEGDLKDAGVNTMFVVGADWMFGPMSGYSNVEQFVGLMGAFGSGDASLDVTTYGIHYGILFALGQMESMSEWRVKLQGGYYNTRVDNGTESADEWSFGGLAGLIYQPKTMMFTIEGGYYFFPEVDSVDNRGWVIMVGIPVK